MSIQSPRACAPTGEFCGFSLVNAGSGRLLRAPELRLLKAGSLASIPQLWAWEDAVTQEALSVMVVSEVRAVFGKVISKQMYQSARRSGTKEAAKTLAPEGLMGLAGVGVGVGAGGGGRTGSRVEDPWDSSAENRISKHQSKK